ncbi:Acyltransferase [Aphelenchoides bicaudatus]|nr:Acyltransferase [Aphelenchoides bicaudatus]
MEHMKEAISKDVTYKLLETNNPIPVVLPSHLLRNDIQSLRALAIFFVLLFHMWPSKVKFGYLGVDMFFVISGYLIFMLLSRKRPINGSKTLNFYFRRIKRIVPIYLFIVGCVLFSDLSFACAN